jgi:hypothetical protein
MKTKHTQGKWIVGHTERAEDSFNDPDTIIQEITEQDGSFIACVNDRHEAEANARLIASAPELLEACKNALQCLNDYELDYPKCDRARFEFLQQAIEKAERG